ncbi:alpha/beta fold hydrolase [Xaviernesmea oryzae]|nr:alpha/beta hydrolase [Xaviernesmea oryzae]
MELKAGEGPSALPRLKTPGGIAYAEAGLGEGAPLVLIHGVGMRLEAWGPQIAAFKDRCRVIAVDMPGHGESAALAEGSGIADFVAWLGRFLDEMKLERVSLAGHSMGAMISGGAVARFPERIARVALLNGVHRRPEAAKAAVLARAAAIRATGVDKDGPLKRWFGEDAASLQARALTRGWLEAVDPEGYAVAYTAFAGGDAVYAETWPTVTCPALFLTGSGDPNSTPEMAQAMAAMAPKGWARIIEGHRHMVNLTAPEAVNGFLAEWLVAEEKPA